MTDLHIALDTFAALVAMEALVKPVAIRLGQWLLSNADTVAPWIPDWLHQRPCQDKHDNTQAPRMGPPAAPGDQAPP